MLRDNPDHMPEFLNVFHQDFYLFTAIAPVSRIAQRILKSIKKTMVCLCIFIISQ